LRTKLTAWALPSVIDAKGYGTGPTRQSQHHRKRVRARQAATAGSRTPRAGETGRDDVGLARGKTCGGPNAVGWPMKIFILFCFYFPFPFSLFSDPI
jgi:hypothetical protein